MGLNYFAKQGQPTVGSTIVVMKLAVGCFLGISAAAFATQANASDVGLSCRGNLNLYNSFGQYARSETLEFRAKINLDRQVFRVVHVQTGPLFQSATDYPVLNYIDDVMTLGASSSISYVRLDRVQLDTETGRMSGTGAIVGRITKGRNIGNRRAEVDVVCELSS